MNAVLSSGIPALDSIVGGGIGNGRILCIEEDTHNSYATLIIKYFLAEGVLSENRICFVAIDQQFCNFMNELPGESLTKTATNTKRSDELDIAWRYSKSSISQGIKESSKAYSGHRFDLSQTLSASDYLSGPLFHQIDCVDLNSSDDLLENILERIQAITKDGISAPLRIVLPSFASPSWGSPSIHCVSNLRPDLTRFFLRLRAIVRATSSTLLLTVPHHVLEDNPGLRERLVALSDYAVQLESYAGSEKEANPVYKDYRGGFHVKKIPYANALCPISRPDTLDLAFKVRTQNFIIEPLYLPPDLSETASRTVSRGGDLNLNRGCGSGSKSKLEF